MKTMDPLQQQLQWLDGLPQRRLRTTGAWPLASVLEHLAQSIEMSMDGYPQPRSALFRQTVGPAAFAVFKLRGRMKHGLAQPIPGAPGLHGGEDWSASLLRLRAAIHRFEVHDGELRPHFAYGALSKGDYAQAHAFHIADHRSEIVD